MSERKHYKIKFQTFSQITEDIVEKHQYLAKS